MTKKRLVALLSSCFPFDMFLCFPRVFWSDVVVCCRILPFDGSWWINSILFSVRERFSSAKERQNFDSAKKKRITRLAEWALQGLQDAKKGVEAAKRG